MKHYLSVIFVAALSVVALASPTDEIRHLQSFVAATGCTYERNGNMHNGAAAIKHIARKYEYFSNDIETAEDFIQYSATKSRISGRYYYVHCGDLPPLKSKDWLLTELSAYRSTL